MLYLRQFIFTVDFKIWFEKDSKAKKVMSVILAVGYMTTRIFTIEILSKMFKMLHLKIN